MRRPTGSVYARCGCRDKDGHQLAGQCAKSVKPGHGSWFYAIDIPSDTPGKRERIRRGGFTTRSQAGRALKKLTLPGPGARQAATVGQWLTIWSESRLRLKPETKRSYRSLIEHYLMPHLGRIPLGELTYEDVKRTLLSLVLHGGVAGRRLSPESLHRIQSCLSTALRAAMREGLINSNPARQVRLPHSKRQDVVVWTQDRVEAWEAFGIRPRLAVWTAPQTAQFLYSIDWHRLYAAFHLMALRGLRRGETAGLRWADIDLEKATLTIRFQNQRRDGELVICQPKTTSSRRTIALDSITVAVLRLHRERQLRELRDLKMPDSGYVCTDTRGLPLSAANLGEQFRRLVRLSGLPPVRLHDLRHGAASLALAAGVDLKSICDQLGHSSILVTADTYVTVLPELALRDAQRVAELILSHGIKVPGTHRTRRHAEPAKTLIRMPSQALAA